MEENTSKPSIDVIADCAKMREEAAQRPFTFADAEHDAKWLRRTPDGALMPHRAKMVIETLFAIIESSPCFYNAAMRGERVFTLMQHDRAAPGAIEAWANEAERRGCSAEKVDSARHIATRWRQQDPSTTRWPD